MESNSIWDIYSNAKRLLPLYPRIKNRCVREESKSLQVDMIKNHGEFDFNSINNEDIISHDSLLTPLSSSPNFVISLKNSSCANSKSNSVVTPSDLSTNGSNSRNNSNFGISQSGNNNDSSIHISNNINSKTNNNNTNASGTMITPTSMSEESPNSTSNMLNKKKELLNNFDISDLLDRSRFYCT